MDVLKQFSYQDVKQFEKDFLLLMNMSFEMDKERGMLDPSLMHNLPEFRECLKLFKKKYRDIDLKTREDGFKILILFPGRNIKKIYEEAANKVDDVNEIGTDFSNTVCVADRASLKHMMDSIKDRIYIKYFAADAKSNTIILKFNKAENAVELIYNDEGITDIKSPSYRLCAFYGCLNGFDKKVDVQTPAKTFYKTGKGSFYYHPTMGR